MSTKDLLHQEGVGRGTRFRFEHFRIFSLVRGLWLAAGDPSAKVEMDSRCSVPEWFFALQDVLIFGKTAEVPKASRRTIRKNLTALFGKGVASFRMMGPKEGQSVSLCVDLPGITVRIASCSHREDGQSKAGFEYYFVWNLENPKLKESGRKAVTALMHGVGIAGRSIYLDDYQVSLVTALDAFAPGAIREAYEARIAFERASEKQETRRKQKLLT